MLGTLNVLEACRAGRRAEDRLRLVGRHLRRAQDAADRRGPSVEPDSPYGASKLAAEKDVPRLRQALRPGGRLPALLQRLRRQPALRRLRQRDPDLRLPDAARRAAHDLRRRRADARLRQRPATSCRRTSRPRDARGVSGAFNIGSGTRIRSTTWSRELAARSAGEPVVEHGPPRPGDVRDSLADISAARAAFGFEPSVSLDDGPARVRGVGARSEVGVADEGPDPRRRPGCSATRCTSAVARARCRLDHTRRRCRRLPTDGVEFFRRGRLIEGVDVTDSDRPRGARDRRRAGRGRQLRRRGQAARRGARRRRLDHGQRAPPAPAREAVRRRRRPADPLQHRLRVQRRAGRLHRGRPVRRRRPLRAHEVPGRGRPATARSRSAPRSSAASSTTSSRCSSGSCASEADGPRVHAARSTRASRRSRWRAIVADLIVEHPALSGLYRSRRRRSPSSTCSR